MARPPFDLTRACFYLLATMMLIVMFETVLALLGCGWMIFIEQSAPIGACANVSSTIRDVVMEFLTAILALLVSRGPPTPPPD